MFIIDVTHKYFKLYITRIILINLIDDVLFVNINMMFMFPLYKQLIERKRGMYNFMTTNKTKLNC